ncbi:MAG TPA: ABC transporter ATP-binding protein [Trebonia sp.]|nr:ABC transporter ATP-binding protein [Trebonia sp.]
MRLESVGKRYGLRPPWAERSVSLDVLPGRLIRLEGRNGSGKSTLLRVAAGVSLPSTGRVTGRPHTGYVPERFPGGLPFSGRDYLLHLARIHGLRGPAAARAVDEWLDRLGAASYAGQPLRALSKGMCQKVALAQALLARPGLLVLDEAWTGLDQAARGELDAAVMERLADGGAVMFVDHEQARLAGRVSERWRLDDSGQVTVVAGAGDGARSGSAPESVVVIELTGLEPSSATVLGGLPGVLSCGDGVVRVASGVSDAGGRARRVTARGRRGGRAGRRPRPGPAGRAGSRARRRCGARHHRRRFHAADQRACRPSAAVRRDGPDHGHDRPSGDLPGRPGDRGGLPLPPPGRGRARRARGGHRGAGRGRGPAADHLDGLGASGRPPGAKTVLAFATGYRGCGSAACAAAISSTAWCY